jgi:hypothetical protein
MEVQASLMLKKVSKYKTKALTFVRRRPVETTMRDPVAVQ